MKNFQVAPVSIDEDSDDVFKTPPDNEDPLDRFRRIAKLAVIKSNERKWTEVVKGICGV